MTFRPALRLTNGTSIRPRNNLPMATGSFRGGSGSGSGQGHGAHGRSLLRVENWPAGPQRIGRGPRGGRFALDQRMPLVGAVVAPRTRQRQNGRTRSPAFDYGSRLRVVHRSRRARAAVSILRMDTQWVGGISESVKIRPQLARALGPRKSSSTTATGPNQIFTARARTLQQFDKHGFPGKSVRG